MKQLLAQIIKFLPNIFRWIFKKAKPKSWKPMLNKEAWLAAQVYFLQEIHAFVPGKVVWKGGKIEKDGEQKKYNIILHSENKGVYKKHYIDLAYGEFSIPNWHTTKPGSKKEYDKAGRRGVTWCNQAASLFSINFINLDLDFERKEGKGIEYNANSICEHFEQGYYNREGYKFVEAINPAEAINAALEGGLAYCTFYNPKGTGHIATVEPNENLALTFTQAGAVCGKGLTFKQCFGTQRRGKVKYWILKEYA